MGAVRTTYTVLHLVVMVNLHQIPVLSIKTPIRLMDKILHYP